MRADVAMTQPPGATDARVAGELARARAEVARAEAQAARANADAQRQAARALGQQTVVNADDGTQIVTSPDGRTTTITEAGGKTTTISTDEGGRVTISENGKTTTIAPGPWSGVIQRLVQQHAPIVAVPEPMPPMRREQLPDGIIPLIGVIFGMIAATIVGLPIARAIARRMDKRPSAPAAPAPELTLRLDRIEQAIESMAVEVERVSEAQRYSARLLTERLPETPARAIAGAEQVR